MKRRALHLVGMAGVSLAISATAHAGMDEQAAAKALRDAYPNIRVSSIQATPVKGLYAVKAGNNVLYFDPQSKVIIFGEMWAHSGENLTFGELPGLLPLEAAVKIGNGERIVIEVADPGSADSRQLSRMLNGYSHGVTRYVFFSPQSEGGAAMAAMVLAAEDKVKVYGEVLDGKHDNSIPAQIDGGGRLAIHQQASQVLGVQGAPAVWVDGTTVSGADMVAIKKLLQQQ